MKTLRRTNISQLAVVIAIALGSVTSSAYAATIQTQGSAGGRWSDPSIWQGGVVPGSSDIAMLSRGSDIVYDSGAGSGGSTGDGPDNDLGSIGTIDSSGDTTVLSLERNLRVRFAYLPDTTIRDGGYDFIVRGTLINGQGMVSGDVLVGKPSPNSGGGSREGGGGNLHVDNLVLLGASQYTFYPGDTIKRSYNTREYEKKWPEITVTQDPGVYGNLLDQGLSFENEAPGALALGRTSATNQAEITLSWDTGMTGPVDWTLRWKGNHAQQLKDYHTNGQIKVAAVPAGRTFNPNDNIFFDSTTGYTYVGFRQASNAWTRKSDIFTTPQGPGKGRFGAVAFSIDGKAYLGTGNENEVYQNDFWQFDPTTNTWSKKAPFPGSPRQYAAGFAIGGKGYLGMGQGKQDIYEYDPATDTWTPKPDFPGTPRSNALAFALGSKGYYGTGTFPGRTLSDFWEFDPSKANPWTQKADLGTDPADPSKMAVGRTSAIGFGITDTGNGPRGYVGLGSDGSLRNYTGHFWSYDPARNAWAPIAPFPGGLIYGTGFGTATKGYAFEPTSGDFYEYDPLANTWTRKASPPGAKPRNSAVSFSIGNKGYYGTGYDYTYLADFWEYTP